MLASHLAAVVLEVDEPGADLAAPFRSQEEAAALAMVEQAGEPVVEPSKLAAPVKMWGISGRQDMMSMRSLMQLRTFQGSKLR